MKKLLLLLLILHSTLSILPSSAQWVAGGTQLSSTPDNHYSVQLVMDANNNAWEVWRSEDTTSLFKGTIYMTGYDSHGYALPGFTGGAIPIGTLGDYYLPQLALSEDGNLFVSWYGYADSTSSIAHIYLQKYTQAGTALWNGGAPIQSSLADLHQNKFPLLAPDKHKGVYLCWTQYDNALSPSSADVLLQRYDSTGAIATGWSATPDPVAANAGVRDSYPRITVSPSGDAVYVQYFEGLISTLSLWLKKVNPADGTIATGFNSGAGVQISAGHNLVPYMEVEMWLFCDTAGYALSCWTEYRTSANGEIYYQRTSPTGTKTLTSNGLEIAGNNGNGYGYLYCSMDDDGDILATWNDYVSNYDIGGAKFTPTGTIVWQHTASLLTTDHNSGYPKILPDHLGGSYIFYSDFPTSARKLNCLHLDGTGASTWSPALLVGNMTNYDGFDPQFDFQVANTTSQQSNVTWNYRTGNLLLNIFACDVLPSKQSCFDPGTDVQSLTARQKFAVYPNPNSGEFKVQGLTFKVEQIEIYNLLGDKVYHSGNASAQEEISVKLDIPAGIYFVKVNNEAGTCLGIQKITVTK